MSRHDEIIGDGRGVLLLLHGRFLLFHNSNVFLRDLQYGIHEYLAAKGVGIRLEETEALAHALARELEAKNMLRRVDEQTWTLNAPEFKRQMEKPPAPAPAAGSAPPTSDKKS